MVEDIASQTSDTFETWLTEKTQFLGSLFPR